MYGCAICGSKVCNQHTLSLQEQLPRVNFCHDVQFTSGGLLVKSGWTLFIRCPLAVDRVSCCQSAHDSSSRMTAEWVKKVMVGPNMTAVINTLCMC